MILLIDNNDSFTYNIVETIRQITSEKLTVVNSADLSINQVEEFDYIILSPGPSLPNDYPILKEVIKRYEKEKAILGICLGHQTICEYYGASLYNLGEVLHGVKSDIKCDSTSVLFKGITSTTVGRYHSWAAKNIPDILKITAVDSKGCVMGVEHKTLRIAGVQFHPESYITQDGKTILKKFLQWK